MDINGYCRLCGSEDGIRVNIFEVGTEHVRKIHKILPITVNEHDPFPKSMCHRCAFKVNEFFEFRTKCIRTQELFKSKVPWLRDKQNSCAEILIPPMVELPLDSVEAVSPNEKLMNGVHEICTIDESEHETPILIEDDSAPCEDSSEPPNPILKENGTHGKIIMKITRAEKPAEPKKKSRNKVRSIWDTKKRKRKSQKTCSISQVYTTSLVDYDNFGENIENEPIDIFSDENVDLYSNRNKSPKMDNGMATDNNGVLSEGNTVGNVSVQLPKHIIVTKIPGVGDLYTCENCGRTFLKAMPASDHVCPSDDDHSAAKDPSLREEEEVTSQLDRVYYCSECDLPFTRETQLNAHKRSHAERATDSSDEKLAKPFNQRKKKFRKKKRKQLHSPMDFTPTECFYPNSFVHNESTITRHSLLSSDSE